jgi:hypothetical protein
MRVCDESNDEAEASKAVVARKMEGYTDEFN